MAKMKSSDRDYLDTGEPILRTKGLRWPATDLCICFVNTAEGRREPSRHRRANLGLVREPLAGYDAIVRWMGTMNALTDAEVRKLLEISDEFPPPAIEANTRLLETRDLFTRMADTLAAGKWPARDDYAQVREMVNELWQPLRFELDDRGVWTCDEPELSLDRPLRQMVFSMARLMTGSARRRVRRCKNEACGLLFVDKLSTGPRRQWCHKRVCGEF